MKTPISEDARETQAETFTWPLKYGSITAGMTVCWVQFKMSPLVLKPLPCFPWKPPASLLPLYLCLNLTGGCREWCQPLEASLLSPFKLWCQKQLRMCCGENKFPPMLFARCHPFPHGYHGYHVGADDGRCPQVSREQASVPQNTKNSSCLWLICVFFSIWTCISYIFRQLLPLMVGQRKGKGLQEIRRIISTIVVFLIRLSPADNRGLILWSG